MEMFERAARQKTRFAYKGQLSVEDLWDLDVKELDKIYKTLNAKLRVCKEDGLLEKKDEPSEELSLQVDIIRHIVGVKLAEADARAQEAARKEKEQKILAIMAEKQDESLRGKTAEELSAMLDSL